MTDSACTRAGYDDTGRYRVPDYEAGDTGDQCPECRTAPGHPHNPSCSLWKWPEEERPRQQNNDDCPVDCEVRAARSEPDCPGCQPRIPLWQQAAMYAEGVDAVLDELQALLSRGTDFRARIIEVGFERLLDGYMTYDSAMYSWTAGVRAREREEELADYLVYSTSGPVK